MVRQFLAGILIILLMGGASVWAQDEDFQSTLDYKVDKMKNELNLSFAQADAIRPIIKDYLVKRGALLHEVGGEGIVDHVSVKATLKALKEKEYEKLSKVLSGDQMKEWINKETIMATLNPDSVESSVDDDGPTLGANGANFKF